MTTIATIPVYFSGFAPVLSWGANMGTTDCITELDNSNEEIIKDGCEITYDWNDPTKVIINNDGDIKTLTLNFYENGSGGKTLIGDPSARLQGSTNMNIGNVSKDLDNNNPYYVHMNCLDCTAISGNILRRENISSTTTQTAEIYCWPSKTSSLYNGFYEDYLLIKDSGTYKVEFTRTKMSGSFTITIHYTSLGD